MLLKDKVVIVTGAGTRVETAAKLADERTTSFFAVCLFSSAQPESRRCRAWPPR